MHVHMYLRMYACTQVYDLRMYACTHQSVSQSVSASQSASKPLNVEGQQAVHPMGQQVNSLTKQVSKVYVSNMPASPRIPSQVR